VLPELEEVFVLAALVLLAFVVVVLLLPPPVFPEEPAKVELMAPNLMLEKTTVESAAELSMSEGTPDVVAQLPRLAPTAVESVG
jgi:hypothetical protein